jgi:hypothetical protein
MLSVTYKPLYAEFRNDEYRYAEYRGASGKACQDKRSSLFARGNNGEEKCFCPDTWGQCYKKIFVCDL